MGHKSVTIDPEALAERSKDLRQAAREFAANTAKAAKELLDSTEKAAGKLERKLRPERKRGRKLFKLLVVGGIGTAIATNEKLRGVLAEQIRKLRGEATTASSSWEQSRQNGDVRSEPATVSRDG